MLCKVMTVLFIDYPCTNILDIFVRFDPTSYTTTEAEGSVTVSVHVDEGLSEPFTVLLIPGEGNVVISNITTWHCTFLYLCRFSEIRALCVRVRYKTALQFKHKDAFLHLPYNS